MPLRSFEMQSTVESRVPVERAWAVFSDVPRWPEWSKVCLAVSGSPGPLWAPGTEFGFRLRIACVGVPFHVRVVESAPPRRVSWTSTRYSVTALRTFDFSAVPGGTVITDKKQFSSTALPIGVCYPVRAIRTMTERWLHDLKVEAERAL